MNVSTDEAENFIETEDKLLPMILYVDDEKLSCRYFERICEGHFTVKTVLSAAIALEFLQQNHDRVQLIVTDQRMPDMQGTELLAEVKRMYPNIIKVITTAFIDEADANQLMQQYDIVSCLYKPWDIDTLIATLESAIFR